VRRRPPWLAASAVLCCIACNSSERDWKAAAEANSLAAYQRFLSEHPDSARARDAESRIESLSRRAAIDSALRAGTTEALERVIALYPSDPAVAKAREKLASLYFDAAARVDSIPEWRRYLEAHGSSAQAAQARARLEALVGERIPAFRDVRTVRVEVQEDYGEAEGVSLPFKALAQQVLPFAGLQIVDGEADAVLSFRSEGGAYSNQYSSFGFAAGARTLYTGAWLSGTIALRRGDASVRTSFDHEIPTPYSYSTSGFGPTTPGSAPFSTAYAAVVPARFRSLVARTFGPSVLFAELQGAEGAQAEGAAAALAELEPFPKERLLQLLRSPGARARVVAAQAIGEARLAAGAPALLAALRTDSSMQATVATALQRIGGPAVPLLIEAVNDPERAVSAAAVDALGRIGDRRAAGPLLARLDRGDEVTRCAIVRAVAGIPEQAALVRLAELLSESNNTVRDCAAAALRIDDAAAFREEDSPPSVAELLNGNTDPALVGALLAALGRGQEMRSVVGEILIRMGDESVPPLAAALRDPRPARRMAAATALGFFYQDERAVRALLAELPRALAAGDAPFAAAICEGAGRLGDDRAVDPLIKALESKDERVRDAAVDALGGIGDGRAVAPLEALRAAGRSVQKVDLALAQIERNDT
jgi:HEAT repeat protein